MCLLIVLLLLLPSNPAGGETLHLNVSVMPEAASALPGVPALQAGIQRLFAAQFGALVSISFEGEPAASASEAVAQVTLGPSGNGLTVSTDLARARATRSLVSTVPTGSPSSLLATITGDLAFLYVSSRGFDTLPLSAPPSLVASLSTDTLGALTGWNLDELEPVGLSASGDEITICFPHRYLTLGPLFRISASTIRDINGQGVGREPMQLSGVIRGKGDTLLLLSEREARFALIDPRLGTRKLGEAPGLSGLPARLAAGTMVAALPGRLGEPGVRLYALDGGAPHIVPVAASYVPAFDIDREGNLWTWDAGERRLRILTLQGREVFSIRPIFSAATMPLPQQLAVFDDGSFLLAGSAEVWKFRGSGVPDWRLARIPGRPGESLPSSFDLAVNRTDGSLTILDAQSRRLLSFSASPGGEAAEMGARLARLDVRKPAEVSELSAFARTSGLGLMAMQFGELLVRGGGFEAERAAARAALLRQKAAGYMELADVMTRDLLYERADGAWLRAAETIRQLAAESPDDEAAAGMLQTVLARRREVRAALFGPTEIQQVSARVLVGHQPGRGTAITLEVTLRNAGSQTVHDVRMHAGLPTVVPSPALAEIGEILPLQQRAVRIPLGSVEGDGAPGYPELSGSPVPVFALLTYERGQEGRTQSLSFSAKAVRDGSPGSLAETLACRTVPQDTLAARLPESLLSGLRPVPPHPLAELAGILASLGAARSGVHGAPGTTAAATAVSTAPLLPSMRNLLRTLSPGEPEWTVVMASIASSLGMPAAIVSVGDRAFALVDTGIPFSNAIAAVPGLERFHRALAALSTAGTLWLPFSGRAASTGTDAAVWAITDALEALAGLDISRALRAGVPASGAQESSPVPFPLVLPVVTTRSSIAELQEALESSLAGILP